MYLVAKPYPYSKRDLVSHELERLGVRVYRATRKRYVPEWANDVLKEIQQTHTLANRELLVIEDGGYFAPLLHKPEFEDLLKRCIGIVEQTTKGIKTDRDVIGDSPKVPILSVAESEFKTEYESPEIGRVTIQNISRFVPNTKLSGRHAVVFGFGSVGAHVAAQLNRTFNMAVSVVDIDPLKRLKAIHRKDIVFEAAAHFDELSSGSRANLVVGTTGKLSMNEEVLKTLPSGCILVSTSSDRVEIEIDALTRLAAGRIREIEEGKTEFMIEIGGEKRTLTLLADGYPINFYGSESLPNDTIDPVMTLLILCGIEVCEECLSAGFHEEYVNDVAKKYALVEEFLKRC